MESSGSSSTDSKYDDGVYSVYEKLEEPPSYPPSQGAKEKGPKLPTAMLACLAMLLVSCFVGILLSGLHFGHKVVAGDCLAQSWVMFSSILGLLYIGLHLQAARKGEPVDRKQPACMHQLHSSVMVIARLDAISWAVTLIIISVAVSQDPVPVSCANLAACTAVTPAILFILCVDETATRPFDLPYFTAPTAASIITCRLSAILPAMPTSEISAEDSISRRGSVRSARSARSTHSTTSQRGNSHTQHAAAIAAANSGGVQGSPGLSGPRPPPMAANVKEPQRWGVFQSYDDRTKKELAASVTEATQASETRMRVGGPRALPLSDNARQTGVLPPPVCLEPKLATEANKENTRQSARASVWASWKREWGNLAAETGYNSTSTTPASTPGVEPHPATRPSTNRRLSPVAELVLDGSSHGARPAATSYFYSVTPARTPGGSRSPNRHTYDRAGAVLRSTPSADGATTPTRARMRLVRAQDALKGKVARDTVVLLNRPKRLTGDRRTASEEKSSSAVAVEETPRRSRSDALRIPGTYVDA